MALNGHVYETAATSNHVEVASKPYEDQASKLMKIVRKSYGKICPSPFGCQFTSKLPSKKVRKTFGKLVISPNQQILLLMVQNKPFTLLVFSR